MAEQNSSDYSKMYQDLLAKMQTLKKMEADGFSSSLADQLATMQVEATLQVKREIQAMNTALQQLIRMQAAGARVP